MPFFVATEEGFIYEPGDVSPGLIRWSDISEGAEAALLSSGSANIGGPRTRPTIVLSLKDPDAVFDVYNPLLREINRVATRIIKYQSGGVGDIVLAAEDFGVHYDAVRALIRDRLGTRWTSRLPDFRTDQVTFARAWNCGWSQLRLSRISASAAIAFQTAS
jgi:hypothetical protein